MKRTSLNVLAILIVIFISNCGDDEPGPGSFIGTVKDEISQEPLNNVSVTFRNENRIEASTITDDRGQYSTNKIVRIPYKAQLIKEGYVMVPHADITPSQINDKLDLFMKPLAAIKGVVTDHENQRLSGVQLLITQAAGFNQSKVSNDQGSYFFDKLNDGNYDIQAKRAGFVTLIEQVVIKAGAPTPKDLRLNSLACIHGIVTDSQGTPLSDVLVSLIFNTSSLESRVTNDLGGFNFEGLESGNYSLKFSKHGYFTSIKSDFTIEVGGPTQVNQKLLPIPFIRGTVTDENNDPLEGVRITISGSSVSNTVDFTDSQGQYNFEGLAFEAYELLFEKEGYKSSTQTVTINESDTHNPIDRVLHAKASIFGTAIDRENSLPISQVTVKLISEGVELFSKITGLEGTFSFPDINEGTYQLLAVAADYEHTPIEVKVDQGKSVQTTLLLQPLPSIMSLSDTMLDFGESETELALDIENIGEGRLVWRVDTEIEGVTFSPRTDSATPTTASTLNVQLDRSTVKHGNYVKSMIVKTEKSGSEVVGISFDVVGKLCSPISELNFRETSEISFDLTNCGEGILEFKTNKEKSWVQVLTPTNLLEKSVTVEVRIDRTGLPPGNYTDQVTITSEAGVVSLPVSMTVTEPKAPQLTISSTSVDFGPELSEMNITVSNTGGQELKWVANHEQSWFSLTSKEGVLLPTESETIKVIAQRGLLEPEKITTGRIKFKSVEEGGESEVEVSISTLTDPKIDLSTNLIEFGALGEQLTFEIIKTGSGDREWNLKPSVSWISVEPSTGINSQIITVKVDRNKVFNDGLHIGHIEVSDLQESVEIQMNNRSTLPELSATISDISVANLGAVESVDDVSLSPGLIADLEIEISNGSGDEIDFAEELRAYITVESPYATTPEEYVVLYGDLNQGQSLVGDFQVTVLPHAPINELIDIKITAWDKNGFSTYLYVQTRIKPALSNQLTSYFSFDDGNAKDLIKDFFAKDIRTTVSTDTPSGIGKSFSFNYLNESHITMGTNLIREYNQEATFNLWLKSDKKTEYMMIFHASGSTIGRNLLGIDENNMIDVAGFTFGTAIEEDLLDGQWHMLTIVLSPAGNLLYIDREQITISDSAHELRNLGLLNEGWVIGRRGIKADSYFDGAMDNIRIYKRALSNDEIIALYNIENGG